MHTFPEGALVDGSTSAASSTTRIECRKYEYIFNALRCDCICCSMYAASSLDSPDAYDIAVIEGLSTAKLEHRLSTRLPLADESKNEKPLPSRRRKTNLNPKKSKLSREWELKKLLNHAAEYWRVSTEC